jgi:hypothetical protein
MGSSSYRVQYIDVDRYLGINENNMLTGVNLYPNPASDGANLNFLLNSSCEVNIELYDLLGSKVAVLFNGNMAPGSHTININTGMYNSGLYFIKMNTGSNNPVTKRLMIN